MEYIDKAKEYFNKMLENMTPVTEMSANEWAMSVLLVGVALGVICIVLFLLFGLFGAKGLRRFFAKGLIWSVLITAGALAYKYFVLKDLAGM